MSKSNRILAVLLVVQAALILGMRLIDEQPTTTRLAAVFEGFDPEKVTQISIAGMAPEGQGVDAKPAPSVELAKDGSQWGISAADGYPADQKKVSEFLTKIGKLKSRGAVVTRSVYHRKLEVSDDKYQRMATLTHDGKELKFFLGTSPGFKNVHLRVAGKDDVVVVADLTTWEVGDKASDWIDRAYAKVPESDIWSMKLQNAKGTIQMDKASEGQWAVLGVTEPLKKSAIDDLLRKASGLTVEEPVGVAEKPEYGFDAPLATITLVTGTSTIAGAMPKETTTRTLKVGRKLEKDNRYYAKASTAKHVVQVAGWGVDSLLSKTAKDLVEVKQDDKPSAKAGDKPKNAPKPKR